MDIKEFYKNRQKKEQAKLNQEEIKQKVGEDNFKKYADTINSYKDLSQDELMQKLFSEAAKLKQNGSLNESSLNALKSTLSPMLNDDQRKMLDNLINMIK